MAKVEKQNPEDNGVIANERKKATGRQQQEK